MRGILVLGAALLLTLDTGPVRADPIVIAHRGASGYLPEHTLAAYRLAIEQGADFIEPDLVATADGHLIARHENALAVLADDGSLDRSETSTDVATRAEFAGRLTTKTIDGRAIRGWFSEDFTLAEIRTLRAIERIPALRPANTAYDGRYGIPTFAEVIALASEASIATGRPIGVYPETKHPTYFAREGRRLDGVTPIGIDLSQALVDALVAADFTDPARVYIQSFEVGNLRDLHDRILPAAGLRLPLILLMYGDGQPYDYTAGGDPRRYADLATPAGLAAVATYAAGIGVHKGMIVPRTPEDRLGAPTTLVRDAHAAGLRVHAWTFRAENQFLPAEHRRGGAPEAIGDLAGEISVFLDQGIDGLFSDHPDHARQAVEARKRRAGP